MKKEPNPEANIQEICFLNSLFLFFNVTGFCWYNIAISAIVTVVTIQLIVVERESQLIVQAIGIFWATFFCSIIFVVPLLLPVSVQSYKISNSSDRSSINSRNRPITKPILSSYISEQLSLYDKNKSQYVASGILETIVEKNHDDDQQHQNDDSSNCHGVTSVGKE